MLNIRIFLWSERAVDLQIGRRVSKACLALFIGHLMSSSIPPSLLTKLPMYTSLSTSLMSSWCSRTGSCCLLFTLMTTVFPMLICRPVFSASAATRHSFSCAQAMGEKAGVVRKVQVLQLLREGPLAAWSLACCGLSHDPVNHH